MVRRLHARSKTSWDGEPFVTRVSRDPRLPPVAREREALLVSGGEDSVPPGFRCYLRLVHGGVACDQGCGRARLISLPSVLSYLSDGDIIRVTPATGAISVLYRKSSPSNCIVLTERCNSRCIMCPQPPRDRDERCLADEWLEAIPLMSRDTQLLGITGGEPTLEPHGLLCVIRALKNHLPHTAVQILSNGRMFSYLTLCQELSNISHPDLLVGVPLYSDLACEHDFIVQSRGAFDQAIRGMMGLRRCGVRVEIRVVLCRPVADRLRDLAAFIARNLSFVEHVALMGLEMMGYVKMNLEALWIDPADYNTVLRDAIAELSRHRLNVSIYNHQLCTLDRALWPYARKSISDWKNMYVQECARCSVQHECGGFFASSDLRRSAHIRPLGSEEPGSLNR